MGGEPGNDKKHFQVCHGLTLLDHQDQLTAFTHFQQSLGEPLGDGIGAKWCHSPIGTLCSIDRRLI